MNQTLNHQAAEPCPAWCAGINCKDDGPDPQHMSAERTVPCAVTGRKDGHVCGYTNCSDPAFNEPSCNAPNFAQIVADSETGTTIEVGHGDELLPAMTPEAAAQFGHALAELAAAAGPGTAGGAIPRPSGAVLVSSRLEAIRGVLEYCLNAETADRQTALERIEQIANASRTSSGVEPCGSASLLPADVTTVLDALDEAADELRARAGMCKDCDASPSDLCDTCENRMARADEYDALFAKLGGAS